MADAGRAITGGRDLAGELIRLQEQMAADRGVWEEHWRQIARRVLPSADLFSEKRTPGEQRTEYIYDSTAPLALEKFAAALESMLTPRSETWHSLTTRDEGLAEAVEVKRWLEAVNARVFSARYDPRANFASQMHELYMQLGAFGTAGMIVEADPRGGIRYRAMHLGEFWIAEDWQGRIDTLHRRYTMTLRQIGQRWGQDKIPEKFRQGYDKNPERTVEVIQCIRPNAERNTRRAGYRGMAFASYHVCVESRTLLHEGGYRSWPAPVSRYVTAPREKYGRSPAMTVLPDIKMLNQMSKTTIRAAHRSVDPPLLLADDGVLAAFQAQPNALNYGGVDDQGRQRVIPLQTGANFPLGLEMEDQRRQVINDAFLVRLFQILVDTPQMTATEVLERAREKGTLLAPTVGRQQSELLGPLITREIDILHDQGLLPDAPPDLIDGGDMVLEIEYDSPLNRAMKADQGIALVRTLESIAPLAQINPGVLDRINADEALKLLAEVNGLPARILVSDREMQAKQAAAAEAQQAQALLQAAPVAADTARTMVETANLARSGATPL